MPETYPLAEDNTPVLDESGIPIYQEDGKTSQYAIIDPDAATVISIMNMGTAEIDPDAARVIVA